jgi:pyruvate-formate lyase-activating enzyme
MLRALLVNPPIFDFTAYDFWLRPYGMMRVAGQMKGSAAINYFDYMDVQKIDGWGRGPFVYQEWPKPQCLSDIPRRFRRFGRPRAEFRDFLKAGSFDVVLIQTMMTYWYAGVKEAIEDIRELQPSAKIVLGGTYATLCTSHANSLGADLVINGKDLTAFWRLLSVEPHHEIPFLPPEPGAVGVIKISEGCPFRCSYCSSPIIYPEFHLRSTADCFNEFMQLAKAGIRNVAFYDDALLFNAEQSLIPFLNEVVRNRIQVLFHTPNALNARFMTADLARLMVKAGFASFFFGLESNNSSWQKTTGGKVSADEFEAAVSHLRAAGAESIITYIIVGHPDAEGQELESSMRFARRCGTRILLSEFSPIPGTTDGDRCDKWADHGEPLSHNKTAFAIRRLGPDYLNKLKALSRELNADLKKNARYFPGF